MWSAFWVQHNTKAPFYENPYLIRENDKYYVFLSLSKKSNLIKRIISYLKCDQ